MGNRYKEYGGGPATGLAGDLISFLSQGLNTGTFGAGSPAGADAFGSTQGIAGVLNDILSGGAGNIGGSMSQMIQRNIDQNVLQARARYGMAGGTAFGTPGQYAEGVIRSQAAPAITSAVGQLQLGAIQNLLGIMSGLAGKGIAQRQGVMSPSPWASAASIAAPILSTALNFMAPGVGSAAAAPLAMVGGGKAMPGGAGGTAGPTASVSQFGYVPTLYDYGLVA